MGVRGLPASLGASLATPAPATPATPATPVTRAFAGVDDVTRDLAATAGPEIPAAVSTVIGTVQETGAPLEDVVPRAGDLVEGLVGIGG